jgi:hypothetical protein
MTLTLALFLYVIITGLATFIGMQEYGGRATVVEFAVAMFTGWAAIPIRLLVKLVR